VAQGAKIPEPTPNMSLGIQETQGAKILEHAPDTSLGIQENRSRQGHPWVFGVLATSIGINLLMVLVWHRRSLTASNAKDLFVGLDSDGDGILDQHDFCPWHCLGGKCSQKGWRSGRATDFDADGCEDGRVDLDKDNDGVNDTEDGCPKTPQHYRFVSSFQSDFDGDGCKDGVEDHDDDDDMVVNSVDRCPRTPKQHLPDNVGCSKLQLENNAADTASAGQCKQPVATEPGTSAPTVEAKTDLQTEERTFWHIGDEWLGMFKSAWVEVLVGAVVTELCGQVYSLTSAVQSRMPVGSVKHATNQLMGRFPALPKIAVRAILYTFVFLLVYAHKYLQHLQHK